jgi:hypothetical protein
MQVINILWSAVEQYSMLDLTKDLYAVVLVWSLFTWRFLLKNHNNFFVFDVTLFMCTFQVMLDEVFCCIYWFLDFSKAFHKVPQKKVLCKLDNNAN